MLIMIPTELDSYHLKERLVENEDFVLIPAEAWRNLLAWYGMVDDQPALERKVKQGSHRDADNLHTLWSYHID